MARPKSEDKKQALLEAATSAIAQQGIAASTALIARNAGVAEGTLFRYFATKDDLLNALYLHLKSSLCETMLAGITDAVTPKDFTRCIWNSYISWGVLNPLGHKAIRRMAVSEKITVETKQEVTDMFPELHKLCQRSVRSVFLSTEFQAFGDALFLSLAETTIEFASHEPERASDLTALGFEAMWLALAEENAA
ncbi:TetR/AcrR family transcriptional regulator [Enterobacteriaceae bacterium C34A]